MDRFVDVVRRVSRGVLPAAAFLAAAVAALADSVGGGTIPAAGSGRISLQRSGTRPVAVLPNLRFEFDGSPVDDSGTGTASAYDTTGRFLLAEIPFDWTARGSTSFTVDLDHAALAAHIEDLVGDATGKSVAASLTRATCKGRLQGNRTRVSVSISASGQATLDGGPPARLHVKMRLR